MHVAHAHVCAHAVHKTILLDSSCCTLRPKIFRMYQTDCVLTEQQQYSISKIPQREVELRSYETGYFYKPRRLSARTVGLTSWLTDWLTDRLLTKLRPKLKLCSDVTTVIGRRTGGSVWGGAEGKKRKRSCLHCQIFIETRSWICIEYQSRTTKMSEDTAWTTYTTTWR